MGTIFDYLDWRGDLSLEADPFNEADNLLINEMAYAHIEDYVGKEERVTVAEAAERYFAGENNPDFTLGVEALRKMGRSTRFKDLELYNIKTYVDKKTQFGAMCVDLPGNITYIVFRGTDESISGWREDFAISFKQTFSQLMALQYLKKNIADDCRKYIVGGHSKGGNLAVYAAMRLNEERQKHILGIYNFDGPGLCPEIVDLKRFDLIRDRIFRFAPSYSIVGRLFEQDVPAVTIASCEKGILQHDAKSWQIMGPSLVRTDFIPEDCKLTNRILKNWIDSASLIEREAFTKEFFDALEVKGSETMIEFKKNGLIGILNVVYSVANFSPSAKKAFAKLLKSASKNAIKAGTGKISSTVAWLADKTVKSLPMPDIRLSRPEP